MKLSLVCLGIALFLCWMGMKQAGVYRQHKEEDSDNSTDKLYKYTRRKDSFRAAGRLFYCALMFFVLFLICVFFKA